MEKGLKFMAYKRKKKNPFKIILIAALCLCVVVAGFFGAAALYNIFFSPQQPQQEEKGPTMYYNGTEIPISENASKNELDPELFYSENGRIYYNDPDAKYGIDVSSHQGEIDWAKVAADGIDFAIIRAGYRGYGAEGQINADEYFEANVKGALENGLEVGVYFFSQAITPGEAQEEAQFVLDLIKDYNITYPVIFDWEHIIGVESARTYSYEDFDVSSFANAFCQKIADAGYDATVYFNPSQGYLIYDIDEISQHQFWLAQYSSHPDFYYGFSIWQYTNAGTVDGVATNVDINISFIDCYKQ